MNRVIQASDLLNHATHDARSELDADPGNILLAMRLARLQVLSSLCQTFGVGADIASGYVPISFAPTDGMDMRSSAGNELDESCGSITPSCACAPERGQTGVDDISGGCHQLSPDLESS